MRVYFLDVGQGTCNVIPVGKRRAVVVDAGREYRPLKRLLHQLKITTVSVLVVSHGDLDHWGGAPALLDDTTIKTEKVCFHFDHKTTRTRFWAKLEERIAADEIDPDADLVGFDIDDEPRQLWRAADDPAVELKILAPTFGQLVRSHAAGDANAASGVLVLKAGGKAIVFPGDAHYRQWEAIRAMRGAPLACDVLAVPHHGGIIWDTDWTAADIDAGLDDLYQRLVTPRYAVVSAGTSNGYDHPKLAVVRALRRAGATVLCTQMTARCHPDLEARRAAAVLPLLPTVPGASRPDADLMDDGTSRNVACAGTVVVDISAARVEVHRVRAHQAGVDALGPAPPLCRP